MKKRSLLLLLLLPGAAYLPSPKYNGATACERSGSTIVIKERHPAAPEDDVLLYNCEEYLHPVTMPFPVN